MKTNMIQNHSKLFLNFVMHKYYITTKSGLINYSKYIGHIALLKYFTVILLKLKYDRIHRYIDILLLYIT